MAERVDRLFGGEPPPDPGDAEQSIRLMRRILFVALPLDLFGILCWTGVPGAMLTLWAWLVADGEMGAVEAGVYGTDVVQRIRTLRAIAFWALVFCVVSLMAQAWLLSTSFYEALWARLTA